MEDNRSNVPSISPGVIVVAAVFIIVSVIGINWFASLVPVVLPPQASAESKSVDELFYILVIIGGVVFFLIQGMLLVSVLFFRARGGDTSDGPTYHGNPLLELIWTIIPSAVRRLPGGHQLQCLEPKLTTESGNKPDKWRRSHHQSHRRPLCLDAYL